MKFKSAISIVIGLLPSLAWALLVFNPGTYELEGKIIKVKEKTFFSINYRSNAETRFELTGNGVSDLQEGSNAILQIRVSQKASSFSTDARFIGLVRYLDPFEVVKIYNNEAEMSKIK